MVVDLEEGLAALCEASVKRQVGKKGKLQLEGRLKALKLSPHFKLLGQVRWREELYSGTTSLLTTYNSTPVHGSWKLLISASRVNKVSCTKFCERKVTAKSFGSPQAMCRCGLTISFGAILSPRDLLLDASVCGRHNKQQATRYYNPSLNKF